MLNLATQKQTWIAMMLYGLNLGHEFSFRHMAIVVSNDIKASVMAVVPLTSYRDGDENYATNVVIDPMQYGYMVQNKTTIKIGHIRNIDKKKRIKKIIKPFVSKTLKIKIKEAIKRSFE
jgi:mRNA-degrading endonuclease toxin of MazEF toxin-antitoxin module